MDPEKLIWIARKAVEQAYAPYSTLCVGSVMLCSDGTVFKGCNIENASFSLTNCAERTAIFSAIAAGKRSFSAIAIAASNGSTPYPCGACRQVLAEFCDPDFPVYVAKDDGYESLRLGDLLPSRFELGRET